MDFQATRLDRLYLDLAGYQKTHVYLIEFNGLTLRPAGDHDDAGLDLIITFLSNLFHLTADQSLVVMFALLIAVPLAVAGVLFWKIYRKTWCRALALVWLLALTLVVLRDGDVYLVAYSLALCVIPACLAFFQKKQSDTKKIAFALGCGLLIGVAHCVRAYSGMAMALFIFCFFVLRDGARRTKLLIAVMLMVGYLLPVFGFRAVLAHRDRYLHSLSATYEAPPKQHILWHNAYIGLGFLSNDFGITYLDDVGFKRVKAINPNVIPAYHQYDAILRGEVFSLIRHHPLFAVKTFFAKFGVIQFYLLLAANIGLWAAWRASKGKYLESAFWMALAWETLPSFIAVPRAMYLQGFITIAGIYGIVSVNHLLDKKALSRT